MFQFTVVLMIVVSTLEIWGLIAVGQWIGGWSTFLLIVLTSGLGAYFAKKEAHRVWQDARIQLAEGQMPGRSLLDGICIFIGGLLLVFPGFLTDVIGFLLVFPLTRSIFRSWLLRLIRKKLENGTIRLFYRR